MGDEQNEQNEQENEQKNEQKKVDEAIEATFPSSDTPSYGKDVGPDQLANFDAVVEKKDKAPGQGGPKR